MAYTSYNAYIVQNNGAVVLAIMIVNYLAFTFNIRPLTYLLEVRVIKTIEFILSSLCIYNVWSVLKGFVLPYVEKEQIPYRQYLFAPGPATLALRNFFHCVFSGKTTPKTTKPEPTPTTTTTAVEKPKVEQLFLNFLGAGKPATATDASTTTTAAITTDIQNDVLFSPLRNLKTSKGSSKVNALEYFLTKDATTEKLAAYSKTNESFTGTIPELHFTPCIKPPLEPSAHRERTLWYLNRTPEVVDDFRIEQILSFRKNWHKFNDRLSRTYYDRMTNTLHEKIFKPLAKSISHFNSLLAARHETVAKCSSATIGLSFIIPGFNNDSAFTISEVIDFITLENYGNEEAKQYVADRIVELSRSNKLAAYRFTPTSVGMPTDSQIIMHALSYYLTIKEPRAIPPLVPADTDLFKFLLVYIYMTPELDHWRIFE